MKQSLTCLFVLLMVCCKPAFSQNFFVLAPVNKDALAMKSYAPDPEAEAVALYTSGDSRFAWESHKFNIIFTKKMRIKIFNKTGYSFGEVEIPYYKDETVQKIKGTTYNLENGEIIKNELDPKSIFDEKINDNWNSKKFAMPEVRDGSIIEYEYQLVTDDKFNLPDWDFQLTIPVVHSEYNLRLTPYYEYQFILKGTNKFTSMIKVDDQVPKYLGDIAYYEMIYQFTLDNLPAFRDEAYITSIRDYQISLDFQLSKINQTDGTSQNFVSTWPLLNDKILKTDAFGKYIKTSEGEAKKYIKNLALGTLSAEQKIEKISEAIKADFKWNGGESVFTTKSPKEFFEQKSGNAPEINLFMLACLKAAEIEAYPVILSTRDHGKVDTEYPFLHFFNYTIINAQDNGKQYLLDGTDIFLPFNRIPINCINGSGLIVKEKSGDWIDLSSLDNGSVTNEKFEIKIDPSSDSLEVHARIVSSGYDASSLKSKTGIKYDKIKEELSSRGFSIQDSIVVENFIDRKKDYLLDFSCSYPCEKIEKSIVITPFFHEAMQENLLKSPARLYPVDLVYSKTRNFETSFKVPQGYRISFMPENYSVDHALVRIDYSALKEGDVVTIKGTYEFKKSVYKAAEYKNLRFFMSDIVKRFNDKIILEKIPAS